jgi:hypothetical protein
MMIEDCDGVFGREIERWLVELLFHGESIKLPDCC